LTCSILLQKEEANGALINNNMNFDAALAELKGMQQQRGGDYGGGYHAWCSCCNVCPL